MCGRYTQTKSLKELAARFGTKVPDLKFTARYNVAPSQLAPVVINDNGRRLDLYKWGLIPVWAKEAAIGYKMINARGETITEKPSYKRPFQKQRCLVLADSFFEWQAVPGVKTKTPMRILLKSHELFAMAGLWDHWKDPEGTDVRSFSIITVGPNKLMKRAEGPMIHERMPCILNQSDEDRWLDPTAPIEQLQDILRPYPEKFMEAYPISTLVNSPQNDLAACIEPVKA